MIVELLFATWVVCSLLYLLQPLLRDDVSTLRERSPWRPDTEADDTATEPAGRPMTDGGRVCQNCGAHIDGEFTYCGECLTPVV